MTSRLTPAYVLSLACKCGHTTTDAYAFELGRAFVEQQAQRLAGYDTTAAIFAPPTHRQGESRCAQCGSSELTATIDTRF